MRLKAAPSASTSSRSSPTVTRALTSPEATRRAARLDAFGGVLGEIEQHLADKALVADEADRFSSAFNFNADVSEGDALSEHGVARDLGDVRKLHLRRRHAREGRKLIDHAADVGDLPEDRIGALDKGVLIGRDFGRVFLAQAFG
jgi:hypothetical protein